MSLSLIKFSLYPPFFLPLGVACCRTTPKLLKQHSLAGRRCLKQESLKQIRDKVTLTASRRVNIYGEKHHRKATTKWYLSFVYHNFLFIPPERVEDWSFALSSSWISVSIELILLSASAPCTPFEEKSLNWKSSHLTKCTLQTVLIIHIAFWHF